MRAQRWFANVRRWAWNAFAGASLALGIVFVILSAARPDQSIGIWWKRAARLPDGRGDLRYWFATMWAGQLIFGDWRDPPLVDRMYGVRRLRLIFRQDEF